MTYGQSIRKLRQLTGLTQPDVAKAAGITPAHLSHIEHGRRNPSLSVMERIDSFLRQQLAARTSELNKDQHTRKTLEELAAQANMGGSAA